ncbi:hypothetical protein CRG98_004870 [Punica granatum]|uniref:Retrotransposon gag domain-containing protein n=1 Tax=Punica granatum TaxID=22663 RepID=A0A2I0L238_PUNGR|nr:hypothetical protein CRG98_004870 [Punica granatum]
MTTDTRNQELNKLAAALEEQDKAVVELRNHTNNRMDQMTEMISGIALQQNQLMTQLQADETPDDIKLKVVVIHLKGRALQWHQSFKRSLGIDGKTVNWGEYVAALVSRFGEMGYDDLMADLKNLK